MRLQQQNLLPYDGDARLVDDAAFDWPHIAGMLAETIPWRVETARIFGREMPVPRMTAWFGDVAYVYSGIRHEVRPLPDIVRQLRDAAEKISRASFNAVLLNLYRNGADSVGWHSDNEAGLGDRPTIASLSLGATRRFQFRHRRTRQTIELELHQGQWLIMAGDTQRCWLHQVPKTAAVVGRRINLTFRQMLSAAPPV